ncbi:trypco2 family protein [Kitasatospora cineracea]|uniref:trypco2 family protein n=1 Tax=Kitasatospora cineracea TaxID=88074 RepID=UPI0034162052
MTDRQNIELADAIEAIRLELLAAAERGRGQAVQFEVGPVTLDFTVELTRDARAKAGIKAWVLSADAEAGLKHTRTHQVSVTLTPKDAATGGSLDISHDNPGNRDGF